MRLIYASLIVLLALTPAAIWPQIDLFASGLFYRTEDGFFLKDVAVFEAVHVLAHAGPRIIGLALVLLTIMAAINGRPVFGLGAKAWLFLLLGLLLGPALLANGILKEYWGRARPREILEFGGALHFSPALIPVKECFHNCSFVAGDGAFGFYLPIFAYVVAWPKSRHMFWSCMGLGVIFSFVRLAVGAHFLSDILFAGFFMQIIFAILHGLMFGWAETGKRWRLWLFSPVKSVV